MHIYPKTAHKVYYSIIAGALIAVIVGWLLGNINTITLPGSLLVSVARLFGLIAAFSILLEVLLISRIPLVENYFDLDRILDLHRLNGYGVLLGTIGHIVFLSFGYSAASQINAFSQFIQLNTQNRNVLLASIGTIIFFIAALISIKIIRQRLKYEVWYSIHLFIYVAILLVFFHQISNGGDFKDQVWFKYYWITLYVLVLGSLLIYRLSRPIYKYFKHKFTIQKITREAEDIYSIIVTGKNITKFLFLPGQYATIRFLKRGLWFQAHPYSVSSELGQDYIRFTIKLKSNYSRDILTLGSGTKVLIEGPRGSFIPTRSDKDVVILIACGIGIAPFLSSINKLLLSKKAVYLFYAVHSPKMVAFKKQLDNYKLAGLHLKYCISTSGSRIDDNLLKYCASINEDADIFICGPTTTSKLFIKKLASFGVPKSNLKSEQFIL